MVTGLRRGRIVPAGFGDEAQQVWRHPADVVGHDERVTQALLIAVHLDRGVATQSGGRQPGVDRCWIVSGVHPQRVAGRIGDVVLGDVKAELAHFFS